MSVYFRNFVIRALSCVGMFFSSSNILQILCFYKKPRGFSPVFLFLIGARLSFLWENLGGKFKSGF